MCLIGTGYNDWTLSEVGKSLGGVKLCRIRPGYKDPEVGTLSEWESNICMDFIDRS
jgi:hypothetical protein